MFQNSIDDTTRGEIVEHASTLTNTEGEETTVVYYAGTLLLLAETETLSDMMDNIPSLFKSVLDEEMRHIHPVVNDDWTVTIFLDDKPNGLQLHESTLHLYRASQEQAKLIDVLENQNSKMHKEFVKLQLNMESLEERYRGMMSFLHEAINIKQLRDIVIQTANAVDPDILGRDQMKWVNFQ
jgi:hypothetical protein